MNTLQFGLGAVATITLAGLASAEVIMNQIGSMDGADLSGSIGGTQDFDTYDVYDIVAIDDFTTSVDMNLTSVSMVLDGWNGYGGTTDIMGYTVSIFSSMAASGDSIYGDVMEMGFLAAATSPMWSGAGDLISFDLGGYELDAGTYWLGITPFNDFIQNGQTGVAGSLIGDNSGAQGNPTGVFGFGPYAPTGANYAYSLEGDAIPAPAAIALLGLAGLASRRRRS